MGVYLLSDSLQVEMTAPRNAACNIAKSLRRGSQTHNQPKTMQRAVIKHSYSISLVSSIVLY